MNQITSNPRPSTTPLYARWPWFALLIVIALHSSLSQPAPQAIGWVEITIALCLMALAGVTTPLATITATTLHRPLADRFAMIACLLLLWTGGMRATVAGWPLGDILRDVVPLLFLFLPILISPRVWRMIPAAYLALAVSIAGGILAWRYLMDTNLGTADWGRFIHGQSLAYLANSPLIAFGAVFGVLMPLFCWIKVPHLGGISVAGQRGTQRIATSMMLAMAVFCWLAMASAGQRAPLLLSMLALVAGVLWLGIGYGFRYPMTLPSQRRLALIAPIVILAGVSLWSLELMPTALITGFSDKFRLVGDNARLAEWGVILGHVGQDIWAMLFGLGWGAHYHSPAVGNYYVGYAHGLMPYLLLKTGLIGWLGIGLYALALVLWAREAYKTWPWATGILLLALMPPVLSAVLFYTSYKFLGFGLLLCVLRCLALNGQVSEPSFITTDHP